METTTIYLMRHGEVHNPEAVLYGRLPSFGLTPMGHEMARSVAHCLKEHNADITHVIASPLKRAQQTAHPIAEAYGLPIEADVRLIETRCRLEGLPVNANRWMLAHPQYWRYYTRPLEPSWGEPYNEVVSRMRAALAHALRVARGHGAVLVSHQMPITTLTRFARRQRLPHSPLSRYCSLASVTLFTFEGSTLTDVSYHEPVAHLLTDAADIMSKKSAARIDPCTH